MIVMSLVGTTLKLIFCNSLMFMQLFSKTSLKTVIAKTFKLEKVELFVNEKFCYKVGTCV